MGDEKTEPTGIARKIAKKPGKSRVLEAKERECFTISQDITKNRTENVHL